MNKPRNVRNFFITGEVDGEATPISTGPTGAGGGFSIDIHMRDAGQVTAPIRIVGTETEGRLALYIINEKGVVIFTHNTTR